MSSASLRFNPPLFAADRRPLPEFERTVIDANFPGAYQVEVADVNGDKKPDIIAVGGGTCAWYENPTWTKRLVTTPKQTPGIISSATADLDGDGKAEIAIAYEFEMNQPRKGKLLLAKQGATPDDPWTLDPPADVPSIHRLRWADVLDLPSTSKRPKVLVIAPLFGPESEPPAYRDPARLRTGHVIAPGKPLNIAPVGLPEDRVGFRNVIHAIAIVRSPETGRDVILSADNQGVSLFFNRESIVKQSWYELNLVAGAPGTPPQRGASEIHLGRLADGRAFLATVEPWHGRDVAVWMALKDGTQEYRDALKAREMMPGAPGGFGGFPAAQGLPFLYAPRQVIDDTLDTGHALWVADVDGDGDDEVFAGHRGNGHRVAAYDFDGKAWNRTILDPDIAAQDLRGGDLDGDGVPDVVAVGGSTHNVVWYRPIRAREP